MRDGQLAPFRIPLCYFFAVYSVVYFFFPSLHLAPYSVIPFGYAPASVRVLPKGDPFRLLGTGPAVRLQPWVGLSLSLGLGSAA